MKWKIQQIKIPLQMKGGFETIEVEAYVFGCLAVHKKKERYTPASSGYITYDFYNITHLETGLTILGYGCGGKWNQREAKARAEVIEPIFSPIDFGWKFGHKSTPIDTKLPLVTEAWNAVRDALKEAGMPLIRQ